MYKHVLLSYDGSIEGLRALREGAMLAKTCGADVFLLSVVPMTAGTLIAETGDCGVVEAQNNEFRELLHRAVDRLKGLGIEPKARLVKGEPIPAIAAVAKEISADLVVVGYKPEGMLARWWLGGSTQTYLCEQLKCTLLIARNPISDEAFDAHAKQLATA
jgi:nucleotide-binding universal stress UspA family protein